MGRGARDLQELRARPPAESPHHAPCRRARLPITPKTAKTAKPSMRLPNGAGGAPSSSETHHLL
jgi:hypothetical protein